MAGRELNRRAIESLIKCGALDNLGNNRREMLLSVESVLDALEADKRRNVEGQMGFFDTPGSSQAGEPPLDKAEDFSAVDKLNMEKEVTGMYLSGHPMSAYAGLYQEGGYARMDEILQSAGEEGGRYQDGQWVTVLGLVNKLPVVGTVNRGLGWLVGGGTALMDLYLVLCVVWGLVVITGGSLSVLNDTVMSGSLYYKVFNLFNPFL